MDHVSCFPDPYSAPSILGKFILAANKQPTPEVGRELESHEGLNGYSHVSWPCLVYLLTHTYFLGAATEDRRAGAYRLWHRL